MCSVVVCKLQLFIKYARAPACSCERVHGSSITLFREAATLTITTSCKKEECALMHSVMEEEAVCLQYASAPPVLANKLILYEKVYTNKCKL